jgi:hypothetical protein
MKRNRQEKNLSENAVLNFVKQELLEILKKKINIFHKENFFFFYKI